jgi:hypothetical protein
MIKRSYPEVLKELAGGVDKVREAEIMEEIRENHPEMLVLSD